MKKTLLYFTACLALLSVMSGCDISGNANTPKGPITAFRIVVASPNASNLNIFLNGSSFASSISYGSYTEYAEIPPGSQALRIMNGNNDSLLKADVTMEQDKFYSVFLVDSVSRLKAFTLKDEPTTVSSDSIRIRIMNFSPNSPPVDVAIKDGDVLSAGRFFGDNQINSSYQNFSIKLKAGQYDLEIKQTGTSTVLQTVDDITFAGGGHYTLFIKGFLTGTGTQAFGLGTVRH
jgi:hypothetical protein